MTCAEIQFYHALQLLSQQLLEGSSKVHINGYLQFDAEGRDPIHVQVDDFIYPYLCTQIKEEPQDDFQDSQAMFAESSPWHYPSVEPTLATDNIPQYQNFTKSDLIEDRNFQPSLCISDVVGSYQTVNVGVSCTSGAPQNTLMEVKQIGHQSSNNQITKVNQNPILSSSSPTRGIVGHVDQICFPPATEDISHLEAPGASVTSRKCDQSAKDRQFHVVSDAYSLNQKEKLNRKPIGEHFTERKEVKFACQNVIGELSIMNKDSHEQLPVNAIIHPNSQKSSTASKSQRFANVAEEELNYLRKNGEISSTFEGRQQQNSNPSCPASTKFKKKAKTRNFVKVTEADVTKQQASGTSLARGKRLQSAKQVSGCATCNMPSKRPRTGQSKRPRTVTKSPCYRFVKVTEEEVSRLRALGASLTRPKKAAKPITASARKAQASTSRSKFTVSNGGNPLAHNTLSQTRWIIRIFKDWLTGQNKDPEFESLGAEEIDELLTKFYPEVRQKDGSGYSHASYVVLRASIGRHLRSAPYNRDVSLVADKEFDQSNNVLKALFSNAKVSNSTKRKPRLKSAALNSFMTEEDVKKLYLSGVLGTYNAKALLRKVFFDLCSYFGQRISHQLRNLTIDSFEFCHDQTGKEYVRLSKLTRGQSKENVLKDGLGMGDALVIYARPGDPNCPVCSLRLYIAKLSRHRDVFFQHPIRHGSSSNKDLMRWYNGRPLGYKILSCMVPNMSKEANLGYIYSNQSILGLMCSGKATN